MFDTWFHGLIILLGDGAINTLQDAIVLGNCIYDVVDTTPKNIAAAFQGYYDQRYPQAKQRVESSHVIATTIAGRDLSICLLQPDPELASSKILLQVVRISAQDRLPPWAVDHGTGRVASQKPYKRYVEEQAGKGIVV
ncbi:hypothetical protein BG011_007050 [Mortierella polycephala]|uniref:Uncharacterized protein n=1 Tax=Mortierella polycephala TaxID=41804 RepID=A0A9P6PUG2_9FUNG|nr:hypothetical protein BG011_007050 [Mortierella polycephala]